MLYIEYGKSDEMGELSLLKKPNVSRTMTVKICLFDIELCKKIRMTKKLSPIMQDMSRI